MDTYFIDYDLHKKGEHDYQKLFLALGLFGAVRMLESLWCIKRSGTSCLLLHDHFRQFIHPDDALSVSRVDDWAMSGTTATPSEGPKNTK